MKSVFVIGIVVALVLLGWLATPFVLGPREPVYQGRPLSQTIRNEATLEASQFNLDQLLTPKQVITGEEPDMATFEVPVSYDVVTNIGMLRLWVDGKPLSFQRCDRATTGNCLLVWNTSYSPPGQHFVGARLFVSQHLPITRAFEVTGLVVPFYSSNICQFDPFYSEFDSRGAILYAKLPESNGSYEIELKTPDGKLVKTFSGSTSNGIIEVHWDLTDDSGKRCTNELIDSVFHVTLSDSGRSQTQKGP